jgi:tetratricopeptide (TPR) repeat protein
MQESIVYQKGLALFDAGRYSDASIEFMKLADRPRSMYHLGLCCVQDGDRTGALSWFKQCLEDKGGDYGFCRNAYYHIGELTENTVHYKVGAKHGDAQCAYKYGIHLYHVDKDKDKDKDRRKAVRWLKKSITVAHPFRGDAFYALGAVYLQDAEKRLDGIKYIEAAVMEGCEAASDLLLQISCSVPKVIETESSPSVAYEAALTLYHEGEPEKAIEKLRNKSVLKTPMVLYTLGLIYLSLQDRRSCSTGFMFVHKAAVAKYPYDKAVSFFSKVESFVR